MSMISAQCDELRQMAESVGLAMPQAATLMMEAADTILSLRDRAQDLQAENAKLREERDNYKALWDHATVTDCELRRVRAAWKEDREKNAKLRELVIEVFECARRGAACETCKVNNDGYACVYIMRELGVVVE